MLHHQNAFAIVRLTDQRLSRVGIDRVIEMISDKDHAEIVEQVQLWKRVRSLPGFGVNLSLRISQQCKNLEGMDKLLRGNIVVKGLGAAKLKQLNDEFRTANQ